MLKIISGRNKNGSIQFYNKKAWNQLVYDKNSW